MVWVVMAWGVLRVMPKCDAPKIVNAADVRTPLLFG